MGLLRRLRGGEPERRSAGLAEDARAMRLALTGIQSELARVNGAAAPVDLRAIVRDLVEGEVEAPTADVAELIRLGEDAGEFYEREVAPSWEGLTEAQRASRVEGTIELARMMDAQGDGAGLPPEMIPRVHTKTLVLAWAFDERYGFLSSIARGQES
jgi:hypothetical protein